MATKHQFPLLYKQQVKNNINILTNVEPTKAKNLYFVKNLVHVGIKVKAVKHEVKTIQNHDKVWLTEILTIKQVTMAIKYNMTEEDVEKSLGGITSVIYDLKVRRAIELMK